MDIWKDKKKAEIEIKLKLWNIDRISDKRPLKYV